MDVRLDVVHINRLVPARVVVDRTAAAVGAGWCGRRRHGRQVSAALLGSHAGRLLDENRSREHQVVVALLQLPQKIDKIVLRLKF